MPGPPLLKVLIAQYLAEFLILPGVVFLESVQVYCLTEKAYQQEDCQDAFRRGHHRDRH